MLSLLLLLFLLFPRRKSIGLRASCLGICVVKSGRSEYSLECFAYCQKFYLSDFCALICIPLHLYAVSFRQNTKRRHKKEVHFHEGKSPVSHSSYPVNSSQCLSLFLHGAIVYVQFPKGQSSISKSTFPKRNHLVYDHFPMGKSPMVKSTFLRGNRHSKTTFPRENLQWAKSSSQSVNRLIYDHFPKGKSPMARSSFPRGNRLLYDHFPKGKSTIAKSSFSRENRQYLSLVSQGNIDNT